MRYGRDVGARMNNRLTSPDGRLLSREDLTDDEARAIARKCEAERVSYSWQRDCGVTVGWCSVRGAIHAEELVPA